MAARATPRGRVVINHALIFHIRRNRLSNCSILDSGTSNHITNQIHQLINFQSTENVYALCGSGHVPILGFGDMIIHFKKIRKHRKPRSIRLRKVAYCREFPLTIVSLQQLEDMDIDWNHRTGQLMFKDNLIGHTRRQKGQYILQDDPKRYQPSGQASEHQIYQVTTRSQAKKLAVQDKQPPLKPDHGTERKGVASWGNGNLWHRRLGHIGSDLLSHLARETLGVRLQAPRTAECDDCALAKITRKPFLQPVQNKATIPFY